MDEVTQDHDRINYFAGNLDALMGAIEDGVVIKSYFPWSFLDNFEWLVKTSFLLESPRGTNG